METTETYKLTAVQGIFKNGRATQEPVAQNELALKSVLSTNIPHSTLMLNLHISGTDENVTYAHPAKNEPWSRTVKSNVTGVKSLSSVQLTPSLLKSARTTFQKRVSRHVLTLKPNTHGICIIKGHEYSPTETVIVKQYINGKLQPAFEH